MFPDIYALKKKMAFLSKRLHAYWFVHTQDRSAWTHEIDLSIYGKILIKEVIG